MKNKFIFSGLIISFILTGFCWAAENKMPDRGRYIYDDRNFLPIETELTLSSYLWQLDSKSGYELVMVFPKVMISEEAIINWFNTHGIGKKKLDNGAAIFVFPDKEIFLAIGSGNDKVSVTAAKTYGEDILRDMDKDPVLALLRFANLLGTRIDEPTTPTTIERVQEFGEKVSENLDIIFLWALVIALIALLVQQKDGFQFKDLIIPGALMVLAGFFALTGLGSRTGMFETYKQYGIITSSQKSTHHWVQTVVVSTGKSTSVILIPHDDYINDVTILSYNCKKYDYRFKTTDFKWAWEREVGEIDALTIGGRHDDLRSVDTFKDNSGGKTIGDGVWLNRE